MQAWLGEREPSGLAISDRVITEFSAALSMKLRSGQIEGHRAGALAMFATLAAVVPADFGWSDVGGLPQFGTCSIVTLPAMLRMARW